MKNKKNLSGIGGWLLLLIITSSISLVLEPIILLGIVANQELSTPNLVINEQWQNYKLALGLIYLCIFIFKLYTINALVRHRNSSTVSLTKNMLWITGPVAFFSLSIIAPAITLDSWHLIGTEFFGVIAATLFALIWTSYLHRSVRVKNTYKYNNEIMSDKSDASLFLTPNKEQEFEDKIYLQIAQELDGSNLNKATMTKAYAICDGDERKTRSLYIKIRYKQLSESWNAPSISTENNSLLSNTLEVKGHKSIFEELVNNEYS